MSTPRKEMLPNKVLASCDTYDDDTVRRQGGDALTRALQEWQAAIGAANVDISEATLARYAKTTLPKSVRPVAILRPQNTTDIQAIVRIASDARVPLYPISCGKNWGYGCANPASSGCVVVDLSGMNRILACDREAGVVTVEPGVTSGDLWAYLDKERLPYLVPVTGAGPDTSILGNALERGHGITPFADHFASLTSLEAVLPNGEIYSSAHAELCGGEVDRLFKWGIGPYFDGIFTQGNFGIVSQVSVALASKPQHIEAFYFSVKHDDSLESAVSTIREILMSVGGVTSSVNLMNARRILSMRVEYPYEQIGESGIIPPDVVSSIAQELKIGDWIGLGAMYGDPSVVKACRAIVRKKLSCVADRIAFVTMDSIKSKRALLRYLPKRLSRRLSPQLLNLERMLEILEGRPNEIALPLAYWKSKRKPPEGQPMDPSRDGCGLIWYDPLVPLKPGRVREFVTMVESTCSTWKIEPLITLTSLSVPAQSFVATVPLLFDKENADEGSRAQACYEDLLSKGFDMGFMAQRLTTTSMSRVVDRSKPFWRFVAKIKDAVDPEGIIAPGRYSV